MSDSEAARQNKLKSTFSSYKGNSRTGKQYDGAKTGSQKLAEFKEAPTAQKTDAVKTSSTDVSPMAQAGITSTSQNLSSNSIYTSTVPSPVKPEYQAQYAAAQNIDSSLLAVDKETVKRQTYAGGSETLVYDPISRSQALAEIRHDERAEAQTAMNLGAAEGIALAYESGVASTLEPVVTNSNPIVRFAGGAAETIAYTPTAIPRLAVGIVNNPVATIREAVTTPIESIHDDPARGMGQVTGMIIGPKIAKTGVRAIRGTVGAVEPVVISGKSAVISAAEGGFSTLKKVGSNPNFDVVGLGRDVSILTKTKLAPISESVNSVLFDAEVLRLKGTGKVQNTASSLESSIVEPVGSGLNKIKSPVSEGVNTVLFDAEVLRLKGTGKVQNTASSLESSLVEPVGSGLNKIKSPVSEGVNTVLFDAEVLRLKGAGKVQNTASSLESSLVEPVGSGLNKIKSPISESVNTVLFDAEVLRLKGTGKVQNTASSLESSIVEPVGSGLNKIKSPISEGVNTVLFDAEVLRLKGSGKVQNTASSLESSLKSKVNPLKDSLKENIDNSVFDLELKRLEGQQKAKTQFSKFLKNERANAEIKPALELEIRELIKSEFKEGSGIKPAPMILPFVHTSPSQNITPFEGVNIGIAERSIQMPSGMEDIEPIQSSFSRQSQRPAQRETAKITAKATGIEELMEIPALEIPTSKYNKNRRNKKPTTARRGSGKEKNLFNKYGDPLQIPDIGRLF